MQDRLPRWLWLATMSIALLCFTLLTLRPLHAQETAGDPREPVRSPYFLVGGAGDPSIDRLPLKETRVDVRISGVIAAVTVTQRYRNEGPRAIEARYVFPGSTRAAVGGLDIRLGDRLIHADIREKQQARIAYDAARQEGRTAALLEQHMPNVFQMNVANILPGDDVQVELRYTELLVPERGSYQFVYPTVVGPRYHSPASSKAAAGWVAQPYAGEGTVTTGGFTLEVALDAPLPIHEARSRTHAIDVRKDPASPRRARIVLAPDAQAGRRDFVLDYRLAGDAIASGVMLQRGTGDPGAGGAAENYFLAMVEPPRSVPAGTILPRDYLFVVDISGSMHGFPLDTAKTMMSRLLGGLRPSDTFNVMLFSGSSRMLSPHSVPVTRSNIDQAVAALAQQAGGGGTELIPALRKAYAQPKPADVSRTVVVVTDGYVTVEKEAFELVRRNLGKANLFAFGIGSSVNRSLIEGLARAGRGEPFVITDPVQAEEQAARFRRMVESPVLTGVSARFEGLDVYDVEPAVLPDVLGERPVLIHGKWRGEPRGRLVVEGRAADGAFRQEIAVEASAAIPGTALSALWARERIAALGDQESIEGDDSQAAAITALGLRHALLTKYTSFLAVDRLIRNPAPAESRSVDQPLPLPQGVSEQALGGAIQAQVPGTPEPEMLGAVAVMLSMLAMLRRRARRRNPARFTS